MSDSFENFQIYLKRKNQPRVKIKAISELAIQLALQIDAGLKINLVGEKIHLKPKSHWYQIISAQLLSFYTTSNDTIGWHFAELIPKLFFDFLFQKSPSDFVNHWDILHSRHLLSRNIVNCGYFLRKENCDSLHP